MSVAPMTVSPEVLRRHLIHLLSRSDSAISDHLKLPEHMTQVERNDAIRKERQKVAEKTANTIWPNLTGTD